MEDVSILAMRTAKAASMAYLYAKDRDGVLIDAGLGCHELWEEAGRRGIRIHAVLLTHSHYDHICGLPELLSRTEGLPVYVHYSERNFLRHPDLNLSTLFQVREGYDVPATPYFDGEELCFDQVGFRVIHTPGHSLGSSCFYDGERVFSGDTLFRGTIGRTDHFFGDTVQEIASIRQRLLTLPGETLLLPGHGEHTTVEMEVAHNGYLRER